VYVVIRRKEKEIRERQELSEAHRKKKYKKGKRPSRPLEYKRSQHVGKRQASKKFDQGHCLGCLYDCFTVERA